MDKREIIKFAYTDMWDNFNPEWFTLIKILKKKYNIITDYENPDFLICGCAGNEYLKYDCPRIQFLGEAIAPDFNIYDYAIGFDHISFGNRYLRCPLYVFQVKDYELAKEKHTWEEDFYLNKSKFCNFIVSNGNGMHIREKFFYKLNEKRKVDSAGRYLNNMPEGRTVENKLEFQKQYKFSLAFENSIMDGYITEKIVQAWAAGTIPIYYGQNNVELDFNENAYIDVSKFSTLDDCIDYILWLDDNFEEYLKIVREPIIKPGCEINYEERVIEFFDYIFEHPEYRRNSKLTMWGGMYEENIRNRNETVVEKIKKHLRNIL